MLLLITVLLLILGYTWVLYPAGMMLAGRRRSAGDEPHAPCIWPEITVLVAAHNEESHIADRVRNLLASDYPADRLFVHVGIDGSTDRTEACALEAAARHANVTVTAFPQRRGKVAVLKDLVARTNTGVLVFTDANTVFRADTIRKLVTGLSDPGIGCACGRLIFVAPGSSVLQDEGGESPEHVYWNLETRLRAAESRLDSCLGTNGAVYAMRRECFWNGIPENTVVDDFALGMKVRQQGLKVLFVEDALAYEDIPVTSHEWKRRVRIGAGDFQALRLCGSCLLPRYGLFAWSFWSHKVLRWLTPLVILAVVLAAGGDVIWRACCGSGLPGLSIAVLAVTALALSAAVVSGCSGCRWLGLVRHFVVMQAALFVGFLRFCRGGLVGHWERTPRARGKG